jgi:hypothetical protein
LAHSLSAHRTSTRVLRQRILLPMLARAVGVSILGFSLPRPADNRIHGNTYKLHIFLNY